MDAIIFCRRSKRSDERSISLDVQERVCRTYASQQGMTVVDVIRLDGVSGADPKRLLALHESMAQFKPQAVLFYHLDRLGREVADTRKAMDGLWASGVQIWTPQNGVIPNTPQAIFIVTVALAAAELQLGEIRLRSVSVWAHLKAQGKRYGKVPYGFLCKRGRLEPNATEETAMALVRTLRAEGRTEQGIADRMTELGYRSRTGKPFCQATVHKILAQQRSVA